MTDRYPIEGVPSPDPSHGPERVVALQLEALATNDDPSENALSWFLPGGSPTGGPWSPFRSGSSFEAGFFSRRSHLVR